MGAVWIQCVQIIEYMYCATLIDRTFFTSNLVVISLRDT